MGTSQFWGVSSVIHLCIVYSSLIRLWEPVGETFKTIRSFITVSKFPSIKNLTLFFQIISCLYKMSLGASVKEQATYKYLNTI